MVREKVPHGKLNGPFRYLKMELLYHIRPLFGMIFLYIGLGLRPYI